MLKADFGCPMMLRIVVFVTKGPNLAEKYGINVVPTLIVFVEGRELNRLVGLKGKEYLREVLIV